ncbi:MAG: 5-formyltetrahydrofolate cyclo-ligase, partial [Rhodobacter sp.]|nr:5-formyltetrahydrofolate cyclo-ligase [Rhodobacter sp.]
HPSPTDILVDHIATPGGLYTVDRRAKRPHGVIWDLLEPRQIEQTPPLQELRVIQGLAPATRA